MTSRPASRFTLLFLLAVAPALAACGGSDGGGGGGGGNNCLAGPGPNYGAFAQNPTAAEAQLAADVVTLVNNERALAGVGPVNVDLVIEKVAFDYSVDMELRAFFDHLNPECEDPGVRLTRAGVVWNTYGENIAQGQLTAAAVMSAWMNSPAHRANILNPAFGRIGVGARQAAGGTIWTQVFTN
jgi:uncharacterized protein YkwD